MSEDAKFFAQNVGLEVELGHAIGVMQAFFGDVRADGGDSGIVLNWRVKDEDPVVER